jgi:hypothetical protein
MFMCSNCDFMDCYNTVLFLNGVIFVFLRVEPWGGSIGGFRGGRAGRAHPLKFAKHKLYNVN